MLRNKNNQSIIYCVSYIWITYLMEFCTSSHFIYNTLQVNVLHTFLSVKQSSPAIPWVRNIPPCTRSSDTSSVPPPRSTTSTVFSSGLVWRPYAKAAAVGSLMTRHTSSPTVQSLYSNKCKKFGKDLTDFCGCTFMRYLLQRKICFHIKLNSKLLHIKIFLTLQKLLWLFLN